jgi:nucleotide-binding universal stress UspA family protein
LYVLNPVPPKLLEFGKRDNPIEENRAEAALRGMRSKWIKREQLTTKPVFQRAQARLRRAGLPAKAVKIQVMIPDPNEGLDSTILEVAKQTKCGTVVVGYTAFSWLKRHMKSHLVKALPEKAEGLAVSAVE